MKIIKAASVGILDIFTWIFPSKPETDLSTGCHAGEKAMPQRLSLGKSEIFRLSVRNCQKREKRAKIYFDYSSQMEHPDNRIMSGAVCTAADHRDLRVITESSISVASRGGMVQSQNETFPQHSLRDLQPIFHLSDIDEDQQVWGGGFQTASLQSQR